MLYICFSMKIAQKIEKQIKKIKDGTTFKYQQLSIEPKEYSAATKAIERLIEKESSKEFQQVFSTNLNKLFLAN